MIEASVIIGTYNQKDILRKTVDSLINQTYPQDKYEVIIVDSSSSDGTEEIFANIPGLPNVHYIRQENYGKAAARNRAIKEAKGNIILITDADTCQANNWIWEHMQCQSELNGAVLVGQTLRVINENNLEPQLPKYFKHLKNIPWSYFLTGNISMPKSVIVNAGLFDEKFIGYGWEDVELGYRLHRMKIPIFFISTAPNYHYHPVDREGALKRMSDMGKSAVYFYEKYRNIEIKLFLGLNPIALVIYHIIDNHKYFLKIIEKRSFSSRLFRYILEQYNYLNGFSNELIVSKRSI